MAHFVLDITPAQRDEVVRVLRGRAHALERLAATQQASTNLVQYNSIMERANEVHRIADVIETAPMGKK